MLKVHGSEEGGQWRSASGFLVMGEPAAKSETIKDDTGWVFPKIGGVYPQNG